MYEYEDNWQFYEGLNELLRRWESWLDRSDVLILDTETIPTSQDSVWEIFELGIINTLGEVVFDGFILPRKKYDKKYVKRARGLTLENLKLSGAPHLSEIWSDVWPLLAAADRLLIYNDNFDLPALHNSLEANNIEITDEIKELGGKTCCIMQGYAELQEIWNNKFNNWHWWKLVDAAEKEGVPVRHVHHAVGDCRMTLGVIRNALRCR